MEKKKTIFCDIDGTLFEYRKFETYESTEPKVLPEVRFKLAQWFESGHMIILTTARPEHLREHTEKELEKNNLKYSKLIMGIERGPRYLINDMDPAVPEKRATAVNLIRNAGFQDIDWQSAGL